MKKKKTISYLQVTNTIFRSLGFADWFVGLSRYRISSEIIAQKKGGDYSILILNTAHWKT